MCRGLDMYMSSGRCDEREVAVSPETRDGAGANVSRDWVLNGRTGGDGECE